MNFRTKQYLRKRFGDYYQNSGLAMPPELARREWGFIFFDELPEVIMRRHKAFSSHTEAVEYIRGMTPAHLYHSAAYYRFPGAATMKEKQWQGADLIFDLDADHLPPEVRGRSYKEMLDAVKKETKKLLDFLLDDFGFLEDNISIVFSGGRGYHIHVRDPKVLTLESPERREIVDYVSGTGFDENSVLYKKRKTLKIHDGVRRHPMDHEIVYEMVEMSPWAKRAAERTVQQLEKIRLLEHEDALKELKEIEGITTKKAEDIIRSLQHFESYDELLKTIFEDGLDQNRSMWSVRQNIIHNLGIKGLEGETDEPVTADVKRLIRMPSSLHGGSGMRVVPLSLSEFKNFDPLIDAIVFDENMIDIEIIPLFCWDKIPGNDNVNLIKYLSDKKFRIDSLNTAKIEKIDNGKIIKVTTVNNHISLIINNEKTRVRLKIDNGITDEFILKEENFVYLPLKPQFSKIEMKGKSFTVTEGINTLPEYAAMYLMCRGAAEYA